MPTIKEDALQRVDILDVETQTTRKLKMMALENNEDDCDEHVWY